MKRAPSRHHIAITTKIYKLDIWSIGFSLVICSSYCYDTSSCLYERQDDGARVITAAVHIMLASIELVLRPGSGERFELLYAGILASDLSFVRLCL